MNRKRNLIKDLLNRDEEKPILLESISFPETVVSPCNEHPLVKASLLVVHQPVVKLLYLLLLSTANPASGSVGFCLDMDNMLL